MPRIAPIRISRKPLIKPFSSPNYFSKNPSLVLALCICVLCGPIGSIAVPRQLTFHHDSNASKPVANPKVPNANSKHYPTKSQSLAKVPVSFEANSGLSDPRVKFFSRGGGYGLYLCDSEVLMAFNSSTTKRSDNKNAHSVSSPSASLQPTRRELVRMILVGANPQAEVKGLEELPGRTNYFIGNDPQKWRTDVVNYRKVMYQDIYPGVDMLYYGDQGKLEYDFVVAPHADPQKIHLKFIGDVRLKLDRNGDLLLVSKSGVVRQHKPIIYQDVNGTRSPIDGGYVVKRRGEVSFRIGKYDVTKPLILDPVITYSTYLGGTDLEQASGIAVDSANNIYVSGITDSTNFPLANPFQSINKGGNEQSLTMNCL